MPINTNRKQKLHPGQRWTTVQNATVTKILTHGIKTLRW